MTLKGNSKYKFTRLKPDKDLEIALAEDSNFLFRKHFHNSFCIGYVLNGIRLIEAGEEKKEVNEGDIFIINPGEVHSCSSPETSKCTYIIISVSYDVCAKLFNNCTGEILNNLFLNNFVTDDISRELFEELAAAVRNKISLTEIKEFTDRILTRLILLYSKDKTDNRSSIPSNEIINKAKLYIEEHYLEKLPLMDLSKEAGLSIFHLCRLFYKQIGLAPHEYQVLLRIKNSGKMLDSGMSPSEAAYENSFTDQAYFTRVFKKYNGITPGEYIAAKQ